MLLGRFRRYVPAQYFWPVAALLGACFSCLLILLSYTSSSQDQLQKTREIESVEREMKAATQMVQRDLQDYAQWDDAVRHFSPGIDAGWIDENITAYLARAQGYTYLFAIDGQDRTVYAYGRPDEPRDAADVLGSDFASVMRELRKAPVSSKPMASGFSRDGDRIYAYAVAAVVPLSDKVALPPGPPYLLVIATRVDHAYLRKIAQEQGLAPLRLIGRQPAPGDAAVAVTGYGGRTLAWVHWMPARPGGEVRYRVLPTFIVVAILALVAAGLILRRGGRTIEALRVNEALARHHADHDHLTGLANRRALVSHIRIALDEGLELTLLHMDVDGFKNANDVYGHAAGDVVLREAARRIVMAAPEALVARAGGDEFAVLINGIGPDRVEAIANAVLDAFHLPFSIGAYSLVAGISIGSATAVGGADGGEDELMRRADVAMSQAKINGKDCWVPYAPGMDEDHLLRLRTEADLRAAVEAGDIKVLFQPIVDAHSGRVVAAEALARWSHPVHGEVPPEVFIQVAETSGLISALGKHVLRRACIKGRDWGISISVNLSPAQFWDRTLVRDVRTVLAETGFPPEQMELEITENFLLHRPAAAAELIDELRTLGIRIALDDFGTGFASIGYLRQLHFDRLKIDKSFIDALGADPQADALVAAIVALAHAIGLQITAEGIETELQAVVARKAGCTRLQGWLYGKAMTAADFRARWIEKGEAGAAESA